MNFIFYDTETTGTNTAFNQILQFAAVLTDSDLSVIDQFEIRCRLLPHVVPAPMAMKVTGITLKQLIDPALPTYYQMMSTIKAKLESWSPAIFLGYNSFKYDETLLRQAFYQNLHPLYLTNTNGNGRMDIMTLVQITSLLAPKILKIPQGKKGNTYKLDKVAPQNGFDHKNAHDAMADVFATIHLANLVRQNAPEIWASFVKFSKKSEVLEFGLNELVFSVTEFHYGKPHSYFVTAIGVHPENKGEIIAIDLVEDPSGYMNLTSDDLLIRLRQSPKPIRKIKSNSCPTLKSLQETLHIAKDKRLDDAELLRRATVLKSDKEFCKKLIDSYIAARGERLISEHVEEQIYDGFFSQNDQKLLDLFHKAPWEERRSLITKLEDQRLKTLGLRLLYCERSDLLDLEIKKQYEVAIAKRLLHSENDIWLTLPKAIQEIDELLNSATENELQILNEHREFLIEWMSKAKE